MSGKVLTWEVQRYGEHTADFIQRAHDEMKARIRALEAENEGLKDARINIVGAREMTQAALSRLPWVPTEHSGIPEFHEAKRMLGNVVKALRVAEATLARAAKNGGK